MKKKQENYMEWLQRSADESKPTKTLLLDAIKARSIAAFESKDKTLLPSVQDLAEITQVNSTTVGNVVLKLARSGEITKIQEGTRNRYAINYDVT